MATCGQQVGRQNALRAVRPTFKSGTARAVPLRYVPTPLWTGEVMPKQLVDILEESIGDSDTDTDSEIEL